ncbi:MAG: hypothetical protein U1E47_01365 [Rivihabitans pingtungensis]
MAGQRDEGLKLEAARQRLDLVDDRLFDLGRMAAGLQQGQHQRGEFMAHRQAGKVDARGVSRLGHAKRRAARVVAVGAQADLVGQRRHLGQQGVHLLAVGAVVQAGDQFNRALQAFEVGFELGLDGVIVGADPGVLT